MHDIKRCFAISFTGGMRCPAAADGDATALYCSALCCWCRDCFEKAVLQDLCKSVLACRQRTWDPFTDSIALDWCMLQDLGKALGMQCVVFNCGEHLDYHFMAKFLAGKAGKADTGVAGSSRWCCC